MKPLLLAFTCLLAAWAQTPPAPAAEPTWANPGESEIGLAASGETDPVKRLELLKKWEQQYPTSALSPLRVFMTTQTLTTLITAGFGKPDGVGLEAGTKAAQQLIRGIGDYFNDSLRSTVPQLKQTSAADWAKMGATSEMQSHALLAYAAMLKKDDATAEAEYRRVLTIDPTQAATSYQLGALLIHEMAVSKNFTKFPEALYELARSLAVTGPNALPTAGKDAATKALKANYTNYHGDTSGMDDLVAHATAAFPPDNFQLLSAQQILNQKQKEHDEWAQQHPDLNLWETIKDTLDQQGDAYFSASLKDVALPPSGQGTEMFKGMVVSMPSPKQILVNIDNAAGDAILKFDDNVKGDIPAGTELHFKGMVDAWTKTPYVVTLEIVNPKTDLTGLPDGVTFVPDKPAHRSR